MDAPALTTDYLRQMKAWPRVDIEEIIFNEDAPIEQRWIARRMLVCDSDDETKGGVKLAQSELKDLLDRLEGKPKSAAEDRAQTNILITAVTTGELLDRIDTFLTAAVQGARPDIRAALEGSTDRPTGSKRPRRKRADPA